jgi:hypothetical protein
MLVMRETFTQLSHSWLVSCGWKDGGDEVEDTLAYHRWCRIDSPASLVSALLLHAVCKYL